LEKSFKPYASYSRLSKYNSCGQAYKLHYIDKIPSSLFSLATLTGSIYHTAAEKYLEDYANSQALDFFEAAVHATLENYKIKLPANLLNELIELAITKSEIYYKCTEAYVGKDAIRTKDGRVSSSPEMTSGFKSAYFKAEIQPKKENIDIASVALSDEFMSVSLSDAFCNAYFLVKQLELPSWFKKVCSIEFEFSNQPSPGIINNEIYWPGTDLLFNGKIDLVCLDQEDELIIIDHKTSSGEAPNESYVKHHEQLNVYAWFYRELFNIAPNKMGINHVKSKKWITSEIDYALAEEIVLNLVKAHHSIKEEKFSKRNPTNFNSPCTYCNFLPLCYPNFSKK
jgi:PD-(D/E)XK nuclease superfamily